MLLGVTGKKSKRKIWMQLRNKIELYKIRRVLKPIGCVSAQRREERLIISFNGNWLGYIEKGKLHIKDSEVSKIYLPEAAVVLDDSGEKYRKVDGKLNPDVFLRTRKPPPNKTKKSTALYPSVPQTHEAETKSKKSTAVSAKKI